MNQNKIEALGRAPARIELARFPGGRRVALTTSFDDGHVYDRRIVEAFNAWGLKGTFNLNSAFLARDGIQVSGGGLEHIDASEVCGLYAGHEVASHTCTHPHLTQLDSAQIALEVLTDRQALEDLVGYAVRGFAYPFGAHDARVMDCLRALGLTYARTCVGSDNCFPPQDPMAWGATAHQFGSEQNMIQRFDQCCADPYFYGAIHLWGHGFEFERRNDWAALDRIYKPLSGRSEVWYCTNLQLFDYEAARQRVVIAANRRTAFNPSANPVTLRVDGKLLELSPGATMQFGG